LERWRQGEDVEGDSSRDDVVSRLQIYQAELEIQNEELREAREKVEVALDRYYELFDLAPMAYVILDQNRVVDEANHFAADLLGVSRRQLKGRGISLFLDEQDLYLFQDHLQEVETTRRQRNCEVRLSGSRPGVIHARVETRLWDRQAPDRTGFLCAFHDITELERRQTELSLAQKFRDQLLSSIGDGFVALDTSEQVVYFNDAAASMLGRDAREVLGRRIEEGLPELARTPFRDAAISGLNAPEPFEQEFRLDSTGRWYKLRVFPGDPLVSVFFRDVTRQKEQDEEQRRLRARLEQGEKLESLGAMASGIAHDFNDILTTIRGNLELTIEEVGFTEPVTSRMRRIEAATEKASELCRQMLTYAGGGLVELSPMNLLPLVDEVERVLRASLPPGMTLIVDRELDEVTVRGDVRLLHQAMLGLIDNAMEASEKDAGPIRVTLDGAVGPDLEQQDTVFVLGEIEARPYARVTVEDRGVGMTPDVVKRAFEPFYTTKLAGRGLGLSAVLGVARSHAGFIAVDSAPQAGTRISLYLPLSDEPVSEEAAPQPRAERPMFSGTVLVIDDEGNVRSIAADLLEALGLDVVTAKGGSEALDVFSERAGDVDCVLVDLTMPGLNGLETARRLKKVRPDLPVVLMSGYDLGEVKKSEDSRDFSAFVQKPFDLLTLSSAIGEALSGSGKPAP
jgi:PAS domain S-box-containing protein